ncbi:MAG: hypothetical protein AAFX06_06190 [Planctomycetota bacterium]
MRTRLLLGIAAIFATAPACVAATVTAGNLLVSASGSNTIVEYTPNGAVVQTINISPLPAAAGSDPRDFVSDGNESIIVFNGTFSTALSTINTVTGAQDDDTSIEFTTSNRNSHGGIALLGNRVFVNDVTVGTSTTHGLIAWDIGSSSGPTRFVQGFGTVDLTAGADGLLYALGSSTASANTTAGHPASTVHVFDPNSLTRVDEIALPTGTASIGFEGLVAAANGELFGIDGDTFYRMDRDGNILDTLMVTKAGSGPTLVDLDISSTGQLLATDRFGEVFLTDTGFSSVSQFNIEISGASNYFAAFASPVTAIPEPSSFAMLGCIAFGLVARRSRTR